MPSEIDSFERKVQERLEEKRQAREQAAVEQENTEREKKKKKLDKVTNAVITVVILGSLTSIVSTDMSRNGRTLQEELSHHGDNVAGFVEDTLINGARDIYQQFRDNLRDQMDKFDEDSFSPESIRQHAESQQEQRVESLEDLANAN